MDTKHATIFKPFHVATTTSALQHYTVVRTLRRGSSTTYLSRWTNSASNQKNVLQASTLFMYYFDDQSNFTDGEKAINNDFYDAWLGY